MPVLSDEGRPQAGKTLRSGGNIKVLSCLSSIANELSLPKIGIDEDAIEKLGRRMWTRKVEAAKGEVSPDRPQEV